MLARLAAQGQLPLTLVPVKITQDTSHAQSAAMWCPVSPAMNHPKPRGLLLHPSRCITMPNASCCFFLQGSLSKAAHVDVAPEDQVWREEVRGCSQAWRPASKCTIDSFYV